MADRHSHNTEHSAVSPDGRHAQYYPAFLDLRGRHVVVVGGGAVAAAKVEGLIPCQPAPLVVVAPTVAASIERAAGLGLVVLRRRPYQTGDAHGAWLVFGATDDAELNARVAADGRRTGALVLAVDDPTNCDLIAPAIIRRGDLVVAISTNGRSPAMARFARENLSADVPDDWARLLDVAATVRERLRTARCTVSAERWQAALRAPELNNLIKTAAPEVAADCLVRLLTPDAA